ncbi:MAG: uroporphyrinogen-III synthase [Janthinobacterium lividum]
MQINDPIIVTRPLAQATALAARVRALGRAAVVFPLLEIAPLPDQSALLAALADLQAYALIAFVSPNAIAAAFAARPHWPAGLHLAVMGEGSRAALAAHGMNDCNATIISPANTLRTDSQTLLETLDIARLRGRQVLVLRGESGRELLADALHAAGAQVTQVAAYRRQAPVLDQPMQQRLRSLIDSEPTWIVTSSEALRFGVVMAAALDDKNAVAKLQRQQLIVPHQRIEETARQLGFAQILLTGSGDAAVLRALQS